MYKKAILFFAILFLIRILFLIFSPLELSPDEAYYWDWSRRLDLCYYSKPPMVAWLIWLSTSFLGATEIGVRFPAVLLGVGTAFFLFLFGKKICGIKAGLLSAILYSSTIGAALLSYIMTIDAPLLFFWCGAMYLFWMGVENAILNKKATFKLFIISGIFAGLGLLSKQTMVAFTIMTLFFLILLKNKRLFFNFKHWNSFLFPQFLCLIPPLYWNYRHNWITFSHTAHHFEQGEKTAFNLTLKFNTFFELLGSQIGIITPIIFLVLLSFSFCILLLEIKNFISKQPINKDRLLSNYLVFIGVLPLLGVFLLSFKQRINANWPAPFYLSMTMLAVFCYFNIFECKGTYFNKIKKLLPYGSILGVLLVSLLYLLPFVLDNLGILGKKIDPTVRLRGWKTLALEVDEILDDLSLRGKAFVVARRRQTVSELAFYLKGQPIVYRWNGKNGKIKSQYELWEGPFPHFKGKDGLIIFDAKKDLKGLDSCFKEFSFLKEIKIPLGSGRFRAFKVYLGKSLISWKE